jgi:putative phosphoribosyl transferase
MTQAAASTIAVSLPPHDGEGLLDRPADAQGLVLFAHGSGSSRLSPRNTYVARSLNQAGLATLRFDLLTEVEAADPGRVFDIPLLAERLDQAAAWAEASAHARGLPLGYFGASTGAAAAVVSAGRRAAVRAVVSRGGRPDLAEDALPLVRAPTLLIVGGADHDVLDLNRAAANRLRCLHRLEVVPGATHLFEEPGALESVVALARTWFLRHLATEREAADALRRPI